MFTHPCSPHAEHFHHLRKFHYPISPFTLPQQQPISDFLSHDFLFLYFCIGAGGGVGGALLLNIIFSICGYVVEYNQWFVSLFASNITLRISTPGLSVFLLLDIWVVSSLEVFFPLFLFLANINTVVMNIPVQVYVWIYVFISLRWIPRSKIPKSYKCVICSSLLQHTYN